jgi:hypothetical protein
MSKSQSKSIVRWIKGYLDPETADIRIYRKREEVLIGRMGQSTVFRRPDGNIVVR